jgi:hypothetical protein
MGQTCSDLYRRFSFLYFYILHIPLNPSGYFMYTPTPRVFIKKFYVQPTQCICVSHMDLRTNSCYFPVQRWLVFVTERKCVYSAVRTESFNIFSSEKVNLFRYWLTLFCFHSSSACMFAFFLFNSNVLFRLTPIVLSWILFLFAFFYYLFFHFLSLHCVHT